MTASDQVTEGFRSDTEPVRRRFAVLAELIELRNAADLQDFGWSAWVSHLEEIAGDFREGLGEVEKT